MRSRATARDTVLFTVPQADAQRRGYFRFGHVLEVPARTGLLGASAVATSGLPPLRMPSSSTVAELWLAVLAFELALLAFLSPRLGEIMVRLGYSEPCEVRRMPVGRTMSALHASSPWRRYAGQVSAGMPSDVWREGGHRRGPRPRRGPRVCGSLGDS